MRFLLTGATGFLGRHLGEALRAGGHELVVLARDADKATRMHPGARVYVWNGNVGLPPADAFDGVDVVVNLIGEDVAGRWTEKRRRAVRDSRVLPTRALVERMQTLSSRPGTTDGFLVKLAGEWEAAAQPAAALGVRTALFRTGEVLGCDGGNLSKLRLPFRLGGGARLGSGKQYFPWIHVADVGGILLHAAAQDQLSGPVNLVAPEPVTNAEFTAALARAFGKSAPFAVPGFALKLALGDMANEMLLASQRMSPARVLQSGYVFRFPLLQDALQDVVQPKTSKDGDSKDGDSKDRDSKYGASGGDASRDGAGPPGTPPAATPPTGTYP